MNPFGAIKDIYKMQQNAKKMQEQMKNVLVVGKSKKEELEVTINGLHELVSLKISNDDVLKDKTLLEKCLKDSMSEAQKQLQKELAKGMDMDSIRKMLGM
ncbi:MAG: YbaB/EbfC family nucleoid-associated protein [Candidatus Dojkabacteria bacterium]|nr:YbaB/EbfC family nucleoid-associated protein [Candidatus Dojkabacteria bacterium]